MKEVVSFYLESDIVQRLARLAEHVSMSRSATLERVLNYWLPLPDDALPPLAEISDRREPSAAGRAVTAGGPRRALAASPRTP